MSFSNFCTRPRQHPPSTALCPNTPAIKRMVVRHLHQCSGQSYPAVLSRTPPTFSCIVAPRMRACSGSLQAQRFYPHVKSHRPPVLALLQSASGRPLIQRCSLYLRLPVFLYPLLTLSRFPQLLRACNSILQSRRSSRCRSLAVRQYSVTPISARAGLIQWVPGLQSIYSSYKSWQQRQFSAQVKAGLATGAEVPAHPPRPSDLYYAKVMAGLKVGRQT